MKRLFHELKRRNVYRVAATYAVVGFVVIQAANLIFPALDIPPWAYSLVVVLVLLGFPPALVIAWAFELTPEGIQRTPETEGTEVEAAPAGEGRSGSGLALKALLGLGLVGAVLAGGWYLVGGGSEGSSRVDAADSAAGRPPVTDRSIAVLPFENLSGTEEARPFVNGIHDDLLTRLANVSDLEVISRTSVLRYRDTELSLPAIAESLGVRWIVEGGVQQVGDQVQVNAHLVRADEDVRRWAESYRRRMTPENLFDVQSDLTKRIAASLEAHLSAGERERVERRPTEDLEAYRLFAQGRGVLEQRDVEGMRTAIEHFRDALRRDSAFAPAWAALGEAYTLLGNYGHAPGDSVYPQAREAIRRALRLDPDLADAHAAAGLLHLNHHDGPAALRELRRAVELQPSLARAHRWLGVMLQVLGRPGALAHYRRSVELDPMSPEGHADLAGALLEERRLEEALRHARRARAIEPDFTLGRRLEVAALQRLGRLEEAISLLGSGDDLPGGEARLAVIHVAAGDTARARELLARLRVAGVWYDVGVVHAELGEEEKAFDALQRVEEWDVGRVIGIRGFSGPLARLRPDPRYRELIRDLNRAWGLNPDGSLPDSVDASFERRADA